MKVTDIKIRKTFPEGNVKAVVSVTLDDFIAIHEIKVVQGNDRMFAAMPNKLDSNDVYRDIVHPISSEARNKLESVILNAYENYIELFAKPKT